VPGLIFSVEFGIEDQRNVQDAFVAAAQQGQGAVRGHAGDRLGEVEPVAELGAFRFLALDDGRPQQAVFLQVFAQLTEQSGVLGKFFHEDLAGAVEHGLGIGETGFGIEEFPGFLFRRQLGVLQQAQRQRLDAGLAGDLRLGAALLLVGQVEILQTLLRFGIVDLGLEFRRQLALFVDAGEDGGAPVFEVAQVGQALFQVRNCVSSRPPVASLR
jgi:hypothetical protein